MAFKIASSPHVINKLTTNVVMQRVALCLLPGFVAQIIFFGMGTLIQVCLAVICAYLFEGLILAIRKKPVALTLRDNSALVTALLLALAIPPIAPWWIIVIGMLFAIVIVKQLYGGLGQNVFNPAMAAYVLLLISFPVQMTDWAIPSSIAMHSLDISSVVAQIFQVSTDAPAHWYKMGIDGMTMATPLDTMKTDLSLGLTTSESLAKPLFSSGLGVGWFWVNLAYLVGGLVMLKLKVIRWQIATSLLASLFLLSGVGFILSPDTHPSPIFHLFSGGTMLAAFFIATDPVTAATSAIGRLVFGALIGALIYVIRTFGGYPDAVAFAVLLANMCAPFIDHYLRPRSYGHRQG